MSLDGIEAAQIRYIENQPALSPERRKIPQVFSRLEFVYLPELEANRNVKFSLRLKNTRFANFHVTALPTVENGQKFAEWLGWMRREAGVSRSQDR